MSLRGLVNLLNEEARTSRATITESETNLILSELTASVALCLLRAVVDAGLRYAVYDSEFSECDEEDISEDMGLFRLTLQKPRRSTEEVADTLYILSEVGFLDFLRKGHEARYWRVFGMSASFTCQSRVFGDWDQLLTLDELPITKSPRMLVKEAADTRTVPDDIRLLLLSGSALNAADPLHRLWAGHAYDSLSRCIANEISSIDRKLVFKGPPKLSLEFCNSHQEFDCPLDIREFEQLHEAAAWVFENSREAEVKHILLSTEIARSGRSDGEVRSYLQSHLAAAFECAKIAYQMSISDVTKDTLKSLGDLRKAVTEETSKATDATRQTVTAIASAAAIGIGLVVARISVALNPWLIVAVITVAWLYVLTIALSGWHFTLVQREVRVQWQDKLYRFLSAGEYEVMVTKPVGRSERVFKYTAITGVGILAVWAICVILFAFNAAPVSLPALPPPSLEKPNAQPRDSNREEKKLRPSFELPATYWALLSASKLRRVDWGYL
ncbi:hypothetical protein ACIUZB_00695 [Pseudomonas aeruginosa]